MGHFLYVALFKKKCAKSQEKVRKKSGKSVQKVRNSQEKVWYDSYGDVISYHSNTMLCQYKNLFGKVGEGAHSYRIANIAMVDTILTILGAYLIHLVTGYHFAYTLLGLFLSGILLHHLFCVRTTVDRVIFG